MSAERGESELLETDGSERRGNKNDNADGAELTPEKREPTLKETEILTAEERELLSPMTWIQCEPWVLPITIYDNRLASKDGDAMRFG